MQNQATNTHSHDYYLQPPDRTGCSVLHAYAQRSAPLPPTPMPSSAFSQRVSLGPPLPSLMAGL